MRQIIAGPQGALEAEWVHEGGDALAVIAHPHPLYGGSMDNKVVHYLHRFYAGRGCATLRFNFRGVGGSEGISLGDLDEVADMQAAIDWAMMEMGGAPVLHLAGFSYGAAVAAQVAQGGQCRTLALVAPPVGRLPVAQRIPEQIVTAVAVAGQDEVVAAEPVQQWLSQQGGNVHSAIIPGASHFFHGDLVALQQVLDDWADSAWT